MIVKGVIYTDLGEAGGFVQIQPVVLRLANEPIDPGSLSNTPPGFPVCPATPKRVRNAALTLARNSAPAALPRTTFDRLPAALL